MNLGQKPNMLADKRGEPDALIKNVLLELADQYEARAAVLAEGRHLKMNRNKLAAASPTLISSNSPMNACRTGGGR